VTHLYLIRHGQAHVNVKQVAGGPKGDTGLTDLGIMQAEKLRDRLYRTEEIRPDIVIASDLPRAKQTAEIVAPLWNVPVIFDKEVQEINVGEADGLTPDEIREKYNLEAFFQDRFHALAPGGESRAQFSIRVGFALKRIITQYEAKKIVIFTHGGVVDTSFEFFFNLSPLAIPPVDFFTQNTSVTHWEKTRFNETLPLRWRLNRYNDDAHLREG
jgi:2,3-bisphosphoglycerate-dependent phosphoglycerate mutase